MTVRRDRWLTLAEVIDLLAQRFPDLLQLRPQHRRQKVRRIIDRAERRDGERYSRLIPGRGGRELVVSRNALESLLPYDQRAVSNLEHAVAQNAQNHRQLRREVKGLGARVRKIEDEQALTTAFLEGLAHLRASNAPRKRLSETPLLSGDRAVKAGGS